MRKSLDSDHRNLGSSAVLQKQGPHEWPGSAQQKLVGAYLLPTTGLSHSISLLISGSLGPSTYAAPTNSSVLDFCSVPPERGSLVFVQLLVPVEESFPVGILLGHSQASVLCVLGSFVKS